MLIVIVSGIYYVQLKNLVAPLTPSSTPLSVEQLVTVIDRNDLIFRLVYQHLLTENNFENYVFTKNQSSLQNYYMNEYLLNELLSKIEKNNELLWANLENHFKQINQSRNKILGLMKNGNVSEARILITHKPYIEVIGEINELLDKNYKQQNIVSPETASITVRLTNKNMVKILTESLTAMSLIFVAALGVALLFAFFSAKIISKPINIFRDEIEKMSAGNLNIPIDPQLLKIRGEIGDLARSFSELINKLKTSMVLRDELFVEIEQRKMIEDKLRQTTWRLQESNRDLDYFANMASHDLRAPLRAMDKLTEWIKEDCGDLLPEKSRNHLDLMQKRIHRLDVLITGILDYSKASKLDTNLEEVDINQIVLEVIENLLPPSHLKVSIEDKLPMLIVNRIAMTQIFQNLLSNAIKYHDKLIGHINIGCEDIGKYYQFYISDDGPGIPSEFHDRVFEAFQAFKQQENIESTGLGLTIVKKIVEKIGGKVWFVTTVGQGTTFYFTWPKKRIKS